MENVIYELASPCRAKAASSAVAVLSAVALAAEVDAAKLDAATAVLQNYKSAIAQDPFTEEMNGAPDF